MTHQQKHAERGMRKAGNSAPQRADGGAAMGVWSLDLLSQSWEKGCQEDTLRPAYSRGDEGHQQQCDGDGSKAVMLPLTCPVGI